MTIRVEVMGAAGAREAFKKLCTLAWLHDSDPSGRRLKWYKKLHDYHVKPSQLRHRRDRTVARRKRHRSRRYPHLGGFDPGGWVEDLHWC
jgi:hypothetical protein